MKKFSKEFRVGFRLDDTTKSRLDDIFVAKCPYGSYSEVMRMIINYYYEKEIKKND